MVRFAAGLLCTTLAIPQANAAAPALHGPPAAAAAIWHAEQAFETRSEQAGAPVAFREFMDPTDGLQFDAGAPHRGIGEIGPAMDKVYVGISLRWTPREVFASTGDLGAVWGVWTASHGTDKPITGHYVTVWRRNAQGQWKALMDIGNPDQ